MSEEKVVSPLESLPTETRERAQAVVSTTCKKHEKIWGLYALGLVKKDIAKVLGTNQGHVGNAIKDYRSKPEKITACVEFFGGVIPVIENVAAEPKQEAPVAVEEPTSVAEAPVAIPKADTGVDIPSDAE